MLVEARNMKIKFLKETPKFVNGYFNNFLNINESIPLRCSVRMIRLVDADDNFDKKSFE